MSIVYEFNDTLKIANANNIEEASSVIYALEQEGIDWQWLNISLTI